MIKGIFFDYGGVLSVDYNLILKRFTERAGIEFEAFETIRKQYNDDLVIGKISILRFCSILKKELDIVLNEDEIYILWEQIYADAEANEYNLKLFKLIKDLKKRYKVGLISNVYDLTVKVDRERKIFDLFEPCILSCEVMLAKPDKEIFKLALERADLKAEECVFVDNKEKNVNAAKELGFYGILYKSSDQLFADLKKLGIAVEIRN